MLAGGLTPGKYQDMPPSITDLIASGEVQIITADNGEISITQ